MKWKVIICFDLYLNNCTYNQEPLSDSRYMDVYLFATKRTTCVKKYQGDIRGKGKM